MLIKFMTNAIILLDDKHGSPSIAIAQLLHVSQVGKVDRNMIHATIGNNWSE